MKIGILTFHWATNYGAILQSYALQTYLEKKGHDVYIINYRPQTYKKTLFRCFFNKKFWLFFSYLKEYIKEMKLDTFRQKYLKETILYGSLEELKRNAPQFDMYVCGSDQIWNPYLTTKGEGNKPTSAYFLDFGEATVKRIAYAVSFGCKEYPEEASDIARKYISEFQAISVREESGISIVKQLGYENPIKLPDPTLLLAHEDYLFENSTEASTQKKAFVYILRNEYKEAYKIISYLKKDYTIDSTNKFFDPNSVEDWVGSIKNASIVITNSFHGAVFSIIFHVPFIVLQASGRKAGMNDRFSTLLQALGLENRVLDRIDLNSVNQLLNKEINWETVDVKLNALRKDVVSFFHIQGV